MTDAQSSNRRQWIVEAAVGAVLLGLAFGAIISSEAAAHASRSYWSALAVLFGVVSLAGDRIYAHHTLMDWRSALSIGLHWFGVFAAIQCVHLFIAGGRMADSNAGLTSGLILALGAFVSGAYGNWRFLVLGAALAGATIVVASIEEYTLVLLGIAVLAVAVMFLGPRLMQSLRST